MAEKISIDLMEMWRESEPKLVLEVQGLKEFRIRAWIACRLIELACLVMGQEIVQYNAAEWSALWKKAAKRERFRRRAMEAWIAQAESEES